MSTLEVVPATPDDPDVTIGSEPTRWFDCAAAGVGAAVRGHVLLALNLRAVDTDVIADAMVLVSELVSNVRDHTPSDQVGVRVRVDPDRVTVAIAENRPTDTLPGSPATLDADPSGSFTVEERGRGLQIVDATAADWGFERVDRVTTAWFTLTIPPR